MRIENINFLLPEDLAFTEETTEPQLDRGEIQISGGITFLMRGVWPAEATDEGVADNIVNGMGLRMLEWAAEHASTVMQEYENQMHHTRAAKEAKQGGAFLMGMPVDVLLDDERFREVLDTIRQEQELLGSAQNEEAEDAIEEHREPDASAG